MKNKKVVILGLNGWMERGHDASACLLINNKIVAFAEEERFTRKRYSYDSMPILSTSYCLREAKIKVDDIDRVVYGWNLPKIYKIRGRDFSCTKKQILKQIFTKYLYKYKKLPELDFMDHHLAHAAGAYRVSGFDEASILVLDGQGEDASGTLAYANGGNIKILAKIPVSYSLGYMMEAACKYVGLRTSDAGKLMGLAGHGKKGEIFDNVLLTDLGYLIKEFPDDKELFGDSLDEQEKVIAIWKKYFREKFGFKTKRIFKFDVDRGLVVSRLNLNQKQKDFALSVQKTLEEVVIHLAKSLIIKTGCKNLVIAGGIGLNCATNGKIISDGIATKLYIQPASNDAGVSIGAALETACQKYGYKFSRLNDIYLGPKFNNSQIRKILDHLKVSYKKPENIKKIVVKSLVEGKTVGWFQGRMEGGPRALGNRSILANPKIKRMHNVVNEIKSRENWRPLAPSILEEKREDFFEHSSYSPFMLQNHSVKVVKRKLVPAVVHVDGTSRYQSVSKKTNPLYYSLIEEFYKLSGIPLVMNTSFNIGGEPIVCTPEQAIKTFYSSAIDCLAIGDYWITKNEK